MKQAALLIAVLLLVTVILGCTVESPDSQDQNGGVAQENYTLSDENLPELVNETDDVSIGDMI